MPWSVVSGRSLLLKPAGAQTVPEEEYMSDSVPRAVDRFFEAARERHRIYTRRAAGKPQPWTEDPIFREFKFCNVFRELDRTTVWCQRHVREALPTDLLLPAVTVFRWFNRIETGEALFSGKPSPFVRWMADRCDIRKVIVDRCGSGPYVNGAYIVKSPDGMNKLDGVLRCVHEFLHTPQRDGTLKLTWQEVTASMQREQWSLQRLWEWLRQHSHQGDFTAYEVVSDLRWTPLLREAPDILKWANAGPGAVRGLNRLAGRDYTHAMSKERAVTEMQSLLLLSRIPRYWPVNWPRWEMREVEHWLCEWDKYERTRLGEGHPKMRFRPQERLP